MQSIVQATLELGYNLAVEKRRLKLMRAAQEEIKKQIGLEIDLGYLMERDRAKDKAFEKFSDEFERYGQRLLKGKYKIRRLDNNLYSGLTLNLHHQVVLIHFSYLYSDEYESQISISKSEEIVRYKTTDGNFVWLSEIWVRTSYNEDEGFDGGEMHYSIFEVEE